MSAGERRLMRVWPDFAKRLGVSRATAYRIVRRHVDYTSVGTGSRPNFRISEEAYEKYLKSKARRDPKAA